MPLSARAIEIFKAASSLSTNSNLVFASGRTCGQLSDTAFTRVLRRLKTNVAADGTLVIPSNYLEVVITKRR